MVTKTGTITDNDEIELLCADYTTLLFTVSGASWSGNIELEGRIEEGDWFLISAFDRVQGDGQLYAPITTNGTYMANISGCTILRFRGVGVTDTATIEMGAVLSDSILIGSEGFIYVKQSGIDTWQTRANIDTGRTTLRFYAVAAAAGTTGTETAITLTQSSGTSATSTGVSFTPSADKTFRITAISFATRGHATPTAQSTTFNFRVNTAGAVTTSSTPIILSIRSATTAVASDWDRVYVEIPEGMEIPGDGTLQWGITAAATYTTNAPTWDVTIIGFEY